MPYILDKYQILNGSNQSKDTLRRVRNSKIRIRSIRLRVLIDILEMVAKY